MGYLFTFFRFSEGIRYSGAYVTQSHLDIVDGKSGKSLSSFTQTVQAQVIHVIAVRSFMKL